MNAPPERPEIALSVVVVAHDMERELPRTLWSLAAPYQRNILPEDYEILVVDNGSSVPLEAALPAGAAASVYRYRIEEADVSPVRAANLGISRARGAVIGLIIDGARMVSPGLLASALRGASVAQRPVVTAPAWHLGPGVSSSADGAGYDQATEDDLLDQAGWETNGYGLFSISTPAASSARGLFGAMGESSSLFLHRQTGEEVGGLDERFALPGGGMVNHDLYRRVCALDDAQLVVLLGEGTFHQTHGGAATSGRLTQEEMRADYEAICGRAHQPPSNQPLFLGSVTSAYLPYLAASVGTAQRVGQADEGP